MKKKKLLYAALILSVTVSLSSCFHDHDISISVNDDEDVYKMKALFDESQTKAVQRIINEHLRQHISLSTMHGFIDTDMTLDDGAGCHIKSRPGSLRINFDKSENTKESCERLKEMCEEIKEELTRRKHNDN